MDPRFSLLLERVVRYYASTLLNTPPARERVAAAGLADAALIERFGVGFADGSLHQILPAQGEVLEHLRLLGLLDKDGRERFAGCLVVPVMDDQGSVVQVAFYDDKRALTWLFDETPTWWNGACLKHERNVVIVRDPMDGLVKLCRSKSGAEPPLTPVIAPAGHGIPLGQGAKDLLLLHAPRLTIRDGDPQWREALAREIAALGLLLETEQVKEAIPSHADEAMPSRREPRAAEIVSQDASGFTVEFPRRLRFVVQGIVQDSPRHLRASVKVYRLPVESRGQKSTAELQAPRIHLDTLDLYHARSRIGFAKTAACLLGEDPAVLEAHTAEVVALAEEFLRKPDAPVPAVILTDREKEEALALLRDPCLLDRVLSDLSALGYVGEETNKLIAYVASVSRKLDDPLSVLVVSRSGAGKSTLAEAAGLLAPPEDVLRLTRLTPQTLYYQKRDALANKLILIEEAEGIEDAAYALRVLQSARHLSLASAAGQGEARTREVRGPVSLFLTTTRTDLDEETAGRFLSLTADESPEQTRRILESQRAAEAGRPADREKVIRLHQNAQRILRPLAVVNPFAPQLAFPHDRLSARRDHKKYLGLIRAVAFLRQYQRKIDNDAVVVELHDIETANRLADAALGQSLYDLTAPSRRLLIEIREWLSERVGKEGMKIEEVKFGQRELRDRVGWRKTQLAGHVKELVEAEYLVVHVTGGLGRRTRYLLDWDGRGMDGEKFFRGLTPATRLQSSGSSGSLPGQFRATSAGTKPAKRGRSKAVATESTEKTAISEER
jgi:energy-coupling factor transporter ATP-binding protein EcfA2